MPALERLSSTRFWSLYRASRRHGPLSEAEQLQRLRRLLTRAQRSVPCWRQRLADVVAASDDAELKRRFLQLPVCGKEQLRAGFPDQVTNGDVRHQWRYTHSAGTVDRMTVVTDFSKRDQTRATNLRVIELLLGDPLAARIVEMPPHACNVVCGLRDEGPPDLWPYLRWAVRRGVLLHRDSRPDLRGRIERSLVIRQDTLAPIEPAGFGAMRDQLDAALDRIAELRPNLLRGLPLFLLWLGQRAEQRSLRFPGLRAVMPYGGLMSGAMARRISAALDAPAIDFYGSSEFGAIGIEDRPQDEVADPARGTLQVFHDLVLVEVVDDCGQPLPPGRPGRVLVTDYHNAAMPLIRYEIGDCGQWLDDTSDEGAGYSPDPWLLCRRGRLQILGRWVERLPLPGGQWIGARALIDAVLSDPRVVNCSLELRGIEPTPADTLRLVPAEAHDPAALTETVRRVELLLQRQVPLRCRIVDHLRPEASGKYRFVRTAGAG